MIRSNQLGVTSVISIIVAVITMASVACIAVNDNISFRREAFIAAPVGQVMYGFVFEAFHASIYLPMMIINVALLVIAGVTQRTLKNEGE